MKNLKPFGPSIGRSRISKDFINKLNKEFDGISRTKKKDYSSKLASQIKNEVNFSKKYKYGELSNRSFDEILNE